MSRLLLASLSTVLIAAGPVEPADWTTLRTGVTTDGRGLLVLTHSQQDLRGFTLVGAGSGVIGSPGAGTAAFRLGYHGGYGGVELGAGMWLDADGVDSRASVTAWGGLPQVHAWVNTWPAEDSGTATTALSGAGIGSQWARVRGEAGVWATEDAGVPMSLRLEGRLNEALWLGASGWVAEDAHRILLTVSVSWAGLAARAARGTGHPM